MLHESVTPSGIAIRFEDGLPDPETGKSKRRSYTVNGQKLDSVTTVLGCLEKPGLMYAAEKLAVKAAIELAQQGELPSTVDGALSRMKSRELRFWQVWRAKADRGTVSHEDLVKLCLGQEPGDMDDFAPEDRGLMRGVAGWFADASPKMDQAEVCVASIEHGFAGRHDLYGILPHVHPTARCLLDLKTTERLPYDKGGQVKAPYPEHLLQLAGYELARRESGFEASEYQAVLRVDADGDYDLFTTVVNPDTFVAVLGAYRALKGVPKEPVSMREAAAA